MVLTLYWSGWKYIVHKVLACRYLNKLDELRRYCGSYQKVVKSGSHISTRVQGSSTSHM